MNKQLKKHIMYQNGSCITLHTHKYEIFKNRNYKYTQIRVYVGFA